MSKSSTRRLLAAGELLTADLFWGFGFVATIYALQSMGPHTMTWIRFLVGGSIGILLAFIIPKWRSSLTRRQFKLAFWPGIWLALTITLQTWGMRYTTATKAGFITTLYVLMVPILEMFVRKHVVSFFHFIMIAVALLGTALICNLQSFEINIGDILVFACAVAASIQIFWFGLIQNDIRSPFVFNSIQCLFAVPIPLVFALISSEAPPAMESMTSQAWIGILSLTFGSTFLAFALQVKAQKYLSPSIASMIFLLEAPIAALFALWLLGESMHFSQWLGAVLIFIAALATVWRPG